jgi:hypothetical protein
LQPYYSFFIKNIAYMIKYIEKLSNKITGLKKGIHANASHWSGQPITESDINAAVGELETADREVARARAALKEALTAARKKVKLHGKTAKQAESLARGIHASDSEKLIEYNIKERKRKQKEPAPGKADIESVVKNHDGTGLLISIKHLEHADHFQVLRAVTEAGVLAPPPADKFIFIKTIQKLTYIDTQIQPGMRYHYMVSGHNHNGDGEPSAVVSAIE